jgi:hypothetical protein
MSFNGLVTVVQSSEMHVAMQASEEEEDRGSDGGASDADEDAEAKAERLGQRLHSAASGDPTAAALGRQAAAARVAAAEQAAGRATGAAAEQKRQRGKDNRRKAAAAQEGGDTHGEGQRDRDGRSVTVGPMGVEGNAAVQQRVRSGEDAGPSGRGAQQQGDPGMAADGYGQQEAGARLGIYGSAGRGILADVAARQRQQLLGSGGDRTAENGTAGKSRGSSGAKAGAAGAVSIRPAPAAEQGSGGAAAAAEGDRPEFVPEQGFKGRRKGYVFRKGDQGQGYYLDEAAGGAKAGQKTPPAKQQREAGEPDQAAAVAAELQGEGNDGDDGVMRPLKGVCCCCSCLTELLLLRSWLHAYPKRLHAQCPERGRARKLPWNGV